MGIFKIRILRKPIALAALTIFLLYLLAMTNLSRIWYFTDRAKELDCVTVLVMIDID